MYEQNSKTFKKLPKVLEAPKEQKTFKKLPGNFFWHQHNRTAITFKKFPKVLETLTQQRAIEVQVLHLIIVFFFTSIEMFLGGYLLLLLLQLTISVFR